MSNAAGMFSGVLMTLSLLAVPCVAVFGLPSVGQAVTDAEVKDGISLGDGTLGTSSPSSAPLRDEPAFGPLVDASRDVTASNGAAVEQRHLDPTSDRRGAAANTAAGLSDSLRAVIPSGEALAAVSDVPPANVFESAASEITPEASHAADGSWEDVVLKLNSLGVRDFHLTNGELAGQFYFTCSMKDSRPNVVRRFEAEAATPVAAAEDVLAQVEKCIATR